MMQRLPLNCVEMKSFDDGKKSVITSLGIDETEFDEAYLFPMQQLIVYNPDIYPVVDNSSLHVFATDATPKYPSIYIAYTFDDKQIDLHYVELKLSYDE